MPAKRRTPPPTTTARTTLPHQQVTATSPKLNFDVDDRPHLNDFSLPGPRREREGRGGAQSSLEVFRYLIRCPLLPALTSAVAERTGGGRPPAYPHIFWVFYGAAIREVASEDQLREELKQHWIWIEIAKEFYFEHGVALPPKCPTGSASFNSWRTNNIIDRALQLDVLLDHLTAVSAHLALAVREAEGWQAPHDLLQPTIWDTIAADGTVITAPSNVRPGLKSDHEGNLVAYFPGSRAKNAANARVHESQRKVNKRSGSPEGLYNLAVTTKGRASYTRTVLAVDIGTAHDAEIPIAMRALRRTYDHLGSAFPTLTYDGAITAKHAQELTAEYGVFTVNANHARNRRIGQGAGESDRDELAAEPQITGEGVHKRGHKAGKLKRTYVTTLQDVTCKKGHVHHLAADDGAVYDVDRPVVTGGTAKRLGAVLPSGLARRQDAHGRHFFQLSLTGDCWCNSTFGMVADLHTARDAGSISWRDPVANIRIIPDVAEHYAAIMGRRNQVESFFFWLDKRFYRHDRAASWGRDAQIFDLLCAALLHNAETWAHLAYRHPNTSEALRRTLEDLPQPDKSGIKPKPREERKKETQRRQRQEAVDAQLAIAAAANTATPTAGGQKGTTTVA